MEWLSIGVTIAMMFWALGTSFLLLRMAVGWIRLSRILRRAEPIEDSGYQAAFTRACALAGCNAGRKPRLIASDEISGPLAAGIFGGSVVLPKHLVAANSPTELADVLVHEVAHVVRRDQIVVLAQNLVAAIYWPHPLVRKLNRELAIAREEVCDNFVLATTEATIYSRTLLSLAQLVGRPETIPGSVGFFASRWRLEQRVAGLLDEHRDTQTILSKRGWAFVLASTLGLLTVICISTVTIATAQNANQDSVSEPNTKPTTLSGNVQETDGSPIAGASIWLSVKPQEENAERTLRRLGTTDANGAFRMTLDAQTDQQIRGRTTYWQTILVAKDDGNGIDWLPIDVFKDDPASSDQRSDLEIQIDRSLGNGSFADRGPVAVIIYQINSANESRYSNDLNQLSIDLTTARPGDVIDLGTIGSNADAKTSPTPRTIATVPITDKQNNVATNERTVRGVVLKPDGRPAVGAIVRASAAVWSGMRGVLGDDYQAPISKVFCDDEGRFKISFTTKPYGWAKFEDTQWKDYWKKTTIAATLPGYGVQWLKFEDVEADDDVTIQLVRDEPIRGRVVDLEGEPRPGVTIEVIDILSNRKDNLDGWIEAINDRQSVSIAASKNLNKQIGLPAIGIPKTYVTDDDGRFTIDSIGRDRRVRLHVHGNGVAFEDIQIATRPMMPLTWYEPDRDNSPSMVFGSEFTLITRPSRTVTGTVVDAETGVPLVSAAVGLDRVSGQEMSGLWLLPTKTDDRGRFEINAAPKGAGNVLLVRPHREQPYFMHEIAVPDPDGLEPVSVAAKLHRGVFVEGRVTDSRSGLAVEGIRVGFYPLRSNQAAERLWQSSRGIRLENGYSCETDADGRYRLVGMPGPAVIGFESPNKEYRSGVGFNSLTAPLDEVGSVKTAIQPFGPHATWPNSVVQVDIPSAKERYTVDAQLDPVDVSGSISHEKELSQSPSATTFPKIATPAEGNSEVQTASSLPQVIRGVVLGMDGKPIRDAMVAVVADKKTGKSGFMTLAVGECRSNENGEFQIPAAFSDDMYNPRLIARTNDSAMRVIDINARSLEKNYPIELKKSVPLRIRLVDLEGQPAAHLTLAWQAFHNLSTRLDAAPRRLTTDGDGIVTIEHVAENDGVWLMTAGDERFAPQTMAINTDEPEERPERDATYRYIVKKVSAGEMATIALSPAQPFVGQVFLGDSDQTAANTPISIWSSQQSEFGSMISLDSTTDDQGRFRLNPYPGIRFGIQAYPPQTLPYQSVELRDLRWSADEKTSAMEIRLPKGAVAEGQVTNEVTGEPIAGVYVQYLADMTNPNRTLQFIDGWQAMVRTGADGRFRVTALPGSGTLVAHAGKLSPYVLKSMGSHEVQLGKPGGTRYYAHAFEKIHFEPSVQESRAIPIILQPSTPLLLRIVDPEGNPIEQASYTSVLTSSPHSIFYRAFGEQIIAGSTTVHGLASGVEQRFNIWCEDRKLGAAATLMGGGETKTVVLHPSGSVTARFIDSTGNPIANQPLGRFCSFLFAMTDGPYPYGRKTPDNQLLGDMDFFNNFNRNQQSDEPKTDSNGEVKLSNLIPGAKYQLHYPLDDESGVTEFTVEPGQLLDLGEIITDGPEAN